MHRTETMSRQPGKRARQAAMTWARHRILAAATLLGLAFAVGGCLGGGDEGTSDSGASVASKGGTLTVGTSAAPAPNLDPAAGTTANIDYTPWAYDPLIYMTPEGEAEPGLATSWSHGPRNESFTMDLRPGVRFSDGTPFDAEAVKTWLEYARDLEGAAPYLSAMESVDVTGKLSLTVNFSEPTPLLERLFSQIYTIGMVASPKAVKANNLGTTTAGAGQYMLDKSATVTGDHYTYVPNPHYWDKDAVHWSKVVVRVMSSPSAALQALKTDQIQIASSQPVNSISSAESSGLEAVAPLVLYQGLSLMDRDGALAEPLADVRVRQALNYAVDRDPVAEVVAAGHGEPLYQMAVPGDDSYDETLNDVYPYDPEKAKQLLADAGYPDGFTLDVLVWTGNNLNTLAQAVQGQLEEVGVELELDVKSSVTDYIDAMSQADYPAATIVFGRLPAWVEYQILWGPDAGTFNPFKTALPEIDELQAELSAAPSDQALAIGQQIQRVLVDEAWFLPIVATPLVVLHSPEVTGVSATENRNVYNSPEVQPAA